MRRGSSCKLQLVTANLSAFSDLCNIFAETLLLVDQLPTKKKKEENLCVYTCTNASLRLFLSSAQNSGYVLDAWFFGAGLFCLQFVQDKYPKWTKFSVLALSYLCAFITHRACIAHNYIHTTCLNSLHVCGCPLNMFSTEVRALQPHVPVSGVCSYSVLPHQ